MLLVFAHIPLNLVEPLCLTTCGWIVCSMLKARFARKRSVNANKRHDVVCSYFSGNDASFTVRNSPPKCVRCKVCCSPVTERTVPCIGLTCVICGCVCVLRTTAALGQAVDRITAYLAEHGRSVYHNDNLRKDWKESFFPQLRGAKMAVIVLSPGYCAACTCAACLW